MTVAGDPHIRPIERHEPQADPVDGINDAAWSDELASYLRSGRCSASRRLPSD